MSRRDRPGRHGGRDRSKHRRGTDAPEPRPLSGSDPAEDSAGADDEAADGRGCARADGERFADLMGDLDGLRRLPGRHSPLARPPIRREPANPRAPTRGTRRFIFPRPDQPLLAYAAGFRKRELRSLQRGEVRAQASVDLHGHDRGAARRALVRAVEDAAHRGVRCLLVIHGRGVGSPGGLAVLKRALPGWLIAPPLDVHIEAFAPAQVADGGAGALYVLIRRLGPR